MPLHSSRGMGTTAQRERGKVTAQINSENAEMIADMVVQKLNTVPREFFDLLLKGQWIVNQIPVKEPYYTCELDISVTGTGILVRFRAPNRQIVSSFLYGVAP